MPSKNKEKNGRDEEEINFTGLDYSKPEDTPKSNKEKSGIDELIQTAEVHSRWSTIAETN